MATIVRLGGTLLEINQDLAEVSQNTLNKLFDTFVPYPSVIDITLTAPPGSPAEQDVYFPAATATGDWAGQEDDFAIFLDSDWFFITPSEGMARYLQATNSVEIYDGTNWVEGLTSVTTGITAAGTTQGAGTVLVSKINEVTTVTGSDDAVVLPAAVIGLTVVVINADSADTMQVFPASGDDIDGGSTDAAVNVAIAEVASFYAISVSSWYSQVGVSA